MYKQTRINWTNFIKMRNEETGNIEGAKCKQCKKILAVVSEERLKSHWQRCQCMRDYSGTTEMNFSDDCNDDMYFDDETEDEIKMKEILDGYLAKFFFSGGLAFRQVENIFLKRFIMKLREFNINYVPPCRLTLAGPILKRVHNETVEKKKKLLQNTDAVLLVDGWRNKTANRKYLVFSVRNVNTPQTFLSFSDISTKTEHSENLKEEINAAIRFAKDKYNCSIYAVVSDNDKKIVKGIQLSRTADNKELVQSTCSSHSANLLIACFVDEDITVMLREIVTTFKDPKLESLLLQKKGTRLRNYPDTRFCYFRNSCESVLVNLPKLRELCNDSNNHIDENVKRRLLNVDFEDVLTEYITNLDPICELINLCQNPKTNIADATEMWLNLRLPNNDYDQNIAARITKALYSVNYAANLLHPKYRGQKLNDDQREIGDVFLRDYLNEEALQELQLYNESMNVKLEYYGNHCADSIDYWYFVSKRFPNIAKYAVRLLLIPAGTALLESLFSQWTFVHNIYRNKLRNEKSADLIDIYYSLKSSYFDDDLIEELLEKNTA